MPDADARGDRFHGTDDDFDPPADVPAAVDPLGLAAAVARFRELSDTAGNPGAPKLGDPFVISGQGRPVPLTGLHAPDNPGCHAICETDHASLHWCTRQPGHPEGEIVGGGPATHLCRCGWVWGTEPATAPGAPGRSWVTTVWDALAVLSADGTHPTLVDLVAQIDDPMCGPQEVLWALRRLVVDGAVAPEGAGEGAQRWHLLATRRPGPGVYEATELARAAASHYGPVARSGEPLSHALNHLAATLTDIGQQLDRIEGKLDPLAHGLETHYVTDHPDPEPITRYDAEARIVAVLTDVTPAHPGMSDNRADKLAARIAEALYGPTTGEGAPTEADNRPPPATRPDLVIAEATIHVLRTRLHPAAFRGIADSDLAFEIAAAAVKALEGAPTEADG